MTVIRRIPQAAIFTPDQGTSALLDVIALTTRADERAIPLYAFDLTVGAPTAAAEALLEPAAGNVLAVGSAYNGSDKSFAFDRYWHGVVVDTTKNDDGTLTITGVSADQRLLEYQPTAIDKTCWTMQDDVRKIWRYVLSAVFGGSSGTAWQQYDSNAPVPLTPFRTFAAASNLVPNGGFEYNINPWSTEGVTTIVRDTSQKHGGVASMRTDPVGTSTDTYAQTVVNLAPGKTYTISGWLLQGTSAVPAFGRARTICIVASAGGVPYVLATSPQTQNVAGRWLQTSMTFTTPPILDAGSVRIRLYNGSSNRQPNTVYWDDILLVEGDGLDTDGATRIPYFDGDTAPTASYTYAWDGTAGLSSSKRTPVIEREPDVLTWSPGQTAYDFLRPILESFGYRTVVEPSWPTLKNRAVPGFELVTSEFAGYTRGIAAIAQGRNLYGLDTGQSRTDTFPDGNPLFADAVIIEYTWTDSLGVEQIAYDIYAPQGYTKPHYLKLAEPFPGVGRAQSLYARLSARRRRFRVVCRLMLSAEPGMQVMITSDRLPAPVLGQADTVAHDLVNGTTTITTKNTVAYPGNSWLRLPAGESWNASPSGASWTAEPIN